MMKNPLQAQSDACSTYLTQISEISINSENLKIAKDSLKRAKLLLKDLELNCPKTWQLLSAHFKLAELYEGSGELTKAIIRYEKIAKIESPMEWETTYTFAKVPVMKFEACEKLAKIYLQQKKFKQANKYALRYLMARRKVLTCGHGFMKWRRELLHLQVSIAFAQADYEDAHLLMRRFTNTHRVISTRDTLLFPLFLRLIEVYYTDAEREELRMKAIESIENHGAGLVADYDLIKISVWSEEIKRKEELYREGEMKLKYLQNEAKRTLMELLMH